MNSQYRKNLKAILEACKQYIDEKISGGEQEMILEVASITGLTNSQCQDLSCGDVVVENNNGAKTTYIVFSKTATTMSLNYVDSTNAKEVKYEVSSNAWAYDETVTTALGGGTQLYYIHVYGQDNGYPTSFTCLVDTDTIETADDLLHYLVNKGFTKVVETVENEGYEEEVTTYIPLGVCGYTEEEGTINGILAVYDENEQDYILSSYRDGFDYELTDVSITYLGHQGE